MQYNYKCVKKIILLKYINETYINDDMKNDFINELLLDEYVTKKFISGFTNDMCELNDMLDKSYIDLENSQVNFNEMIQFKNSMCLIIATHYDFFSFLTDLSEIIQNTEFVKVLFSPEIISTIITVINKTLYNLSERFMFNNTFLIFDFDEDDESHIAKYQELLPNMDNYINYLRRIIINFYTMGIDLKHIINGNSFDIKYYEELNDNIYNENKIDNVIDGLNKTIEKINQENLDDDIPSEFTDPITFCIINDPCLLPGMVDLASDDVFFDKSTIRKQLLIKEINPYTMKQLTLKEFEEFNDTTEIVKKNNVFKEKIEKWSNGKK
jgi:hypothetical protein